MRERGWTEKQTSFDVIFMTPNLTPLTALENITPNVDQFWQLSCAPLAAFAKAQSTAEKKKEDGRSKGGEESYIVMS